MACRRSTAGIAQIIRKGAAKQKYDLECSISFAHAYSVQKSNDLYGELLTLENKNQVP
jgi:hypothetical protein